MYKAWPRNTNTNEHVHPPVNCETLLSAIYIIFFIHFGEYIIESIKHCL